ncbi:hypothetical protein JB92DRAFT_3141532 [Gautieria morchelliformis]|nr:hypothetical protein JB92DRAFT_3141532 [Gautieria morchelliformis]
MNCTGASIIDSDLAGTGIRASLYLQFTIFVLSMNRSHHVVQNFLWGFIAMSFGLIEAALIKFFRGKLPLLEAIVVSQLLWFANVGMMFALILYDSSKRKLEGVLLVHAAAWFQIVWSMVLTIIMWTFSEHLPYGRCTSVRFVSMFGVDLPASGSGRIAALTFVSMLLAAFTLNILSRLWVWVGLPSFKTTKTPEGRIARRRALDEHQRRSGGPLAKLDSFRLGMLLSGIFIFMYFFSTTELILLRSNAEFSPSTWTFGQILAMTLVISLLRAIVEKVTADSEAAGTTESMALIYLCYV